MQVVREEPSSLSYSADRDDLVDVRLPLRDDGQEELLLVVHGLERRPIQGRAP